MPAPWRLRRTVLVDSEKTLPPRSLPIRRMGICLGMRLLLRTTCCGTLAATKGCVAGQFIDLCINNAIFRAKKGADPTEGCSPAVSLVRFEWLRWNEGCLPSTHRHPWGSYWRVPAWPETRLLHRG